MSEQGILGFKGFRVENNQILSPMYREYGGWTGEIQKAKCDYHTPRKKKLPAISQLEVYAPDGFYFGTGTVLTFPDGQTLTIEDIATLSIFAGQEQVDQYNAWVDNYNAMLDKADPSCPHDDHNCGFNATFSLVKALEYVYVGGIVGLIEGFGNIILSTGGFRSSHARLYALSPKMWNETLSVFDESKLDGVVVLSVEKMIEMVEERKQMVLKYY